MNELDKWRLQETTKRKDDWRYEYDNRQRDRKKINTKRDRYKNLENL